ncbi:MAG: 2-amino-4-hydroxy-6-hydroxymethyldihydropteridine diphosphokinase [Betaproteobacteria bacterium]
MPDRLAYHTAYVGLGSNIDDPVNHVSLAIEQLASIPRCRLTARSSLYESAPVGKLDQPPFVNAVAMLSTSLAPAALLQTLLAIESLHGRVRNQRNGPRTLDLDLLLYDEQTIDQPGLEVPHPRMHERAFVLVPLSEINSAAIIPGRGSVAALVPALANQSVTLIDATES